MSNGIEKQEQTPTSPESGETNAEKIKKLEHDFRLIDQKLYKEEEDRLLTKHKAEITPDEANTVTSELDTKEQNKLDKVKTKEEDSKNLASKNITAFERSIGRDNENKNEDIDSDGFNANVAAMKTEFINPFTTNLSTLDKNTSSAEGLLS